MFSRVIQPFHHSQLSEINQGLYAKTSILMVSAYK